jgi:hypothetical protein
MNLTKNTVSSILPTGLQENPEKLAGDKKKISRGISGKEQESP